MKELKTPSCTVGLVQSLSELKDYLYSCEDNSILTKDWETTGLDFDAVPLGLSLHQRGRNPIFVPIDFHFSKGFPMKEVAEICNEQFPRFRLIAHNAKYDSMISVMNGIKDECFSFYVDTLQMIHLYNPNLAMKLEDRVLADFGYAKKDFKEISGKPWNRINWSLDGDELLELLAGYAGEDTYWETKLYYKYMPLLDEHAKRLLFEVEMPMINILRDAKIRGVLINKDLLLDFDKHVDSALSECLDSIYEECGCVFNLNSSPQKQKVFFDQMKLPVIKTTKKGGRSTDAGTYEEWANMGYSVGEALLDYSELQKLITGYIRAIPPQLDSHNVLRGDLNSAGTKTGRMSSSGPNLQNMPNNHNFPVRAAFIPRPGYVFVNYDYSQLELRVMAHVSHDKHFMDIFLHGGDPHGDVAKRCGITRKQAKVMNFGVLYGMGVGKYVNTFKVSKERARQMIDDYHKVYSGFAKWKESIETFAKRNGYVRTIFGRIRQLPEASKDPFHRDDAAYFGALRQAVNTVIQGSGADIVKKATIAMCRKFKERNLDAHFLLQVHDEVLIEARIDQMFEVERIVIDCMENTVKLDVPLLADGKILANWGEMKDDDVVSLPYRFDYSIYSSLFNIA